MQRKAWEIFLAHGWLLFVGSICGSFVVCPTQWSAELLHSLPEGNSLHPLLLGIQLGFFGGEGVIFKQS